MSDKIGVINGLRGFAIIGVIFKHLFLPFAATGWYAVSVSGYTFFPLTFLSNGWVGVNLFFILSGFVLFLPYAKGDRQIKTLNDTLGFYWHRGKRLLPLYYASLIFSMFFLHDIIHADPDAVRNFFLMLTATFSFTTDMWFPKYNIVLWTIGIEIWFSVLFPLLVIIGRRTGLRNLFIGVAVLSFVVRMFGTYYFALFDPTNQSVIKDSLAGRLDDFVLGMLISVMYVERKNLGRSIKSPHLYFFAGVFLVAVGCNIWDDTTLGLLPRYWLPLVNNFFHAGFYLVIISLLFMDKGLVRSVFVNRPVQVMGMMCYSLYIWHLQTKFAVLRGDALNAENLIIYLVVLFIFSAFTYRYIEFGKKDARELFLLGRRETRPSHPDAFQS